MHSMMFNLTELLFMISVVDEPKTQLINFAINDLKGSIPKFVINAGASTHAQLFTNMKKKLEEMKSNGTLPKIDESQITS